MQLLCCNTLDNCSDLVLFELFVADCALAEQRMGAKAENMVTGVVLSSVRGGAPRAGKEGVPAWLSWLHY